MTNKPTVGTVAANQNPDLNLTVPAKDSDGLGPFDAGHWAAERQPLLDGIGPLLPGGPDKRPLVGDGWPEHPGLSLGHLQAANPECICWHIGAAPTHIGVDIDGAKAAAFCQSHGCDPYTADTWRIERTSNTERVKLVFSVTPEQKAALVAGAKTVKIEGQELAVFAKPGTQIVVLGNHYTKESNFTENDDQYAWAGRAPADAQPIPPEWFDLLTGVFCGDRPLRPPTRRAVTASSARKANAYSSGSGKWSNSSAGRPCPICRRDHSGACSTHADGKSVWCCHGDTRSAPDCSRAGEKIPGSDGQTWGYVRTEEHDSFGERSLFVLDKPPQQAQQTQQISAESEPDPSRSEVLKLGFTELLEQALVAIRAEDLDTEMEVRAEIMGRFKRSDTQITAALFRLLTEQETGKPAGSTVKSEALDLDTIEGLDALMDGFIPANDLGLMYGAKGSGKTLAALAMGFAAIDGTGFLDHSKPAQQGPVLFIASDSGAPPLMAAMQDLGVADHPAIRGADRSFYVWAHSASQGMSAWCASINGCVQLLQFVKAKRIKLVLIDSAKTICAKAGISYLDNDSIAALLTFIKEAICPHTSVMILSHDGTEKGSHSGAKVWAEVPSIVHNIQQIPDAPQERLWRVVKNRMGSLRDLRYQVGEGGGLEVCAGVETIQDATAAVIQVLTEATAKGVTSLSRAGLVQEIGQRFRLAPKTVDNTLQRMARSVRPEICRVNSKRGHYKLSPRLAATVSPNKVSPKEEGQGKNLVRESDLVSTRGVGSGYSVGTQIESPLNTQSPGVGYSVNLCPELVSDPFLTREVEMDIGKPGLVEIFWKGQAVAVLDPQTKQWGEGFTVVADTHEATVKVQTPTGRTANRWRNELRAA